MSELNANVILYDVSGNEVSATGAVPLTTEQLDNLSHTISATISALRENLEEQTTDDGWGLKELEFSFGIEFTAGLESSFIFRPIFGAQMKAGSTFQIRVVLSK